MTLREVPPPMLSASEALDRMALRLSLGPAVPLFVSEEGGGEGEADPRP